MEAPKVNPAYLALPMLGYMVYAMFRVAFGVALPEIQASYSMSDVEAGLMVSLGSISIMLSTLYGGYLTDRLGVLYSFLAGAFLFSLGLALFMFALNFWMLTAFLFLAGVGGGILIPTIYTWAGEVLASYRGLSIGITNALFGVGGFVGSWLTGSLLKAGFSWVLPFHIFALICFLSALVCTVLRSRLTMGRPPRRSSGFGYALMLRSKSLLLLFFGMLASNISYFNFVVWIPSFLLRLQNFTIDEGGIALAVFSLAGSVGAVGFGYLYGRIGPGRRGLLASALGFASALIFLPIVVFSYTALVGFILFAFFGFILYPYWNLQITMAQESVDKSVVGRATGLVQSAGLLASVVGPALVGLLIEQAGMVIALLATIFLPLIVYGIIILAWKPGKAF